jgi:uncharacterized membrane protein
LYAGWGLLDGTLQKDLTEFKWTNFIILSSISGFLASYCSVTAVKLGGPVNPAIVEVSYPIFAALFCYILFGQNTINFNVIIGGCLIALGTVFVIRSGH